MMSSTVPPDDHQQAVLNMSKMGVNGKGRFADFWFEAAHPRREFTAPGGSQADWLKPRKQRDYVNRDRRLGETARPSPLY